MDILRVPTVFSAPTHIRKLPSTLQSTCTAPENDRQVISSPPKRIIHLLTRAIGILRKKLRPVATIAFLVLGFLVRSPPAYASTSPSNSEQPSVTTHIVEKLLKKTSPSVDQLIDRYVQKHMFMPDKYDPVESLYREVYDDATRGNYARQLNEITGLSQTGTQECRNGFMNRFGDAIQAFSQRTRLPEQRVTTVVAVAGILGSACLIFLCFQFALDWNRWSTQKALRTRYGNSWSVDATLEEDTDNDDDNDEPNGSKDDETDDDDD